MLFTQTYRVGGPLGAARSASRENGKQLVVDADTASALSRGRRLVSLSLGRLDRSGRGLLGGGSGLGGSSGLGRASGLCAGIVSVDRRSGFRLGGSRRASLAALNLGWNGVDFARADEAVVTRGHVGTVRRRRRERCDSNERGQARKDNSLEMHSEKDRKKGAKRERIGFAAA